ncbi:MAG: DUF166 domain-containing protein [Dethiobacteraceae bacterium]
MRILVLVQGGYGQRVVDNLHKRAPNWQVNTFHVPLIQEIIVDEPELFLPDRLSSCDLLLHLAETPQAAQLLPAIAELTSCKAVIASIDNAAWIPAGLRNQLRKELELKGVTIVFPEPLCSLDENTVGFGGAVQSYANEIICEFSRHFGKPILDVTLTESGQIMEARVLRGSPCGSTEYTVGLLKGMDASKAVPTSGLMCLSYPCLASMKFEQTDSGIDTIMHNSGRIFNEGMENALKKAVD